ncbi:hypothetical protein K439DRAFT_617321 [Ramaria rubella]|nr:hypothetical protein K439DRAFT_617321 [Ramaria rubella]
MIVPPDMQARRLISLVSSRSLGAWFTLASINLTLRGTTNPNWGWIDRHGQGETLSRLEARILIGSFAEHCSFLSNKIYHRARGKPLESLSFETLVRPTGTHTKPAMTSLLRGYLRVVLVRFDRGDVNSDICRNYFSITVNRRHAPGDTEICKC